MRGTAETQLGMSLVGLGSSDCSAFGPYADCWVPSKYTRFLEWAHLGDSWPLVLEVGSGSIPPLLEKRVLYLDENP